MRVYDDIAKAFKSIRHIDFGNEDFNHYHWSAPPHGFGEFVFENLTSLVISLLLCLPNERTTQLEHFIMFLKRVPNLVALDINIDMVSITSGVSELDVRIKPMKDKVNEISKVVKSVAEICSNLTVLNISNLLQTFLLHLLRLPDADAVFSGMTNLEVLVLPPNMVFNKQNTNVTHTVALPITHNLCDSLPRLKSLIDDTAFLQQDSSKFSRLQYISQLRGRELKKDIILKRKDRTDGGMKSLRRPKPLEVWIEVPEYSNDWFEAYGIKYFYPQHSSSDTFKLIDQVVRSIIDLSNRPAFFYIKAFVYLCGYLSHHYQTFTLYCLRCRRIKIYSLFARFGDTVSHDIVDVISVSLLLDMNVIFIFSMSPVRHNN